MSYELSCCCAERGTERGAEGVADRGAERGAEQKRDFPEAQLQGDVEDESMAEADADLHAAQQAQREALQAEQESVQNMRQGLMEVREAMQQRTGVVLMPPAPQLLQLCSSVLFDTSLTEDEQLLHNLA